MHELSLVESIIESVEHDARSRGIKKITRLRVVAGELASVNHRALSFALENVVGGTFLEQADIELAVKEAWASCPVCQQKFKPEPPFYQCPECGKTVFPSSENRQVYIDFYEGE